MAGRRRTRTSILPAPGAAFLMPLADGRNGVCRVIRRATPAEESRMGEPAVLVAASPWVGIGEPDLGEPRLAEILSLTHHSWRGKPEMLWVSTPIPEGFRPLGTLPPTSAEATRECLTSGDWASLPHQVLLQWRWDHEREAVLREDAKAALAREAAKKAATDRAAADRREYLAGLTLEGLRGKRRFAGWKGFVPDEALAATRKLFRETIDALLALGPGRNPRAVARALRGCIESLNRLDEAHGHFIETTVREDLIEEFDEIVFASGFRNVNDAADRWRDW